MLKIESMKARRGMWKSPEINLTLREGEVAAIIGPSGSGKTSILLSIIGLLPYEGTIEYNGVEVSLIDKKYLRSKIAYVPDEPESYILNNKVFDEAAFGPENLGWKPKKVIESTIRALEITGLLNLYNREVSTLSGGQKQRLAIADALSISPEILLLDNPFSNIDWEARKSISKTLKELCDNGLSIILTGYSLEELYLKPDKTIFIGEVGKPYVRKTSYDNLLVSEKFVDVKDVWFSYDGRNNVLKGISLTIGRKEIISVIGKNGVGKTTLLKILAGIYKPSRGTVLINGRKPNPHLSLYVSQNPSAFLTGTTPRDELPKSENTDATSLLEKFGLSYLLDKPIHTLSLGEKRIISIMSGLYRGALLLCLDEPTAGLDYKMGQKLGEILRSAASNNEAFVIATHDISFAEAYSDRILLLDGGIIYEDWRRIFQ